MATLLTTDGEFEYQWASDVGFAGVRLEVLSGDGTVLFDISIPERGDLTISTFCNEIAANLIAAAIDAARERK